MNETEKKFAELTRRQYECRSLGIDFDRDIPDEVAGYIEKLFADIDRVKLPALPDKPSDTYIDVHRVQRRVIKNDATVLYYAFLADRALSAIKHARYNPGGLKALWERM